MRRLVLLLPVLLAGCMTSEQLTTLYAGATPPTPEIKHAILEAARNYLKDPYSIRDAEISGVFTMAPNVQGVCVRYNSKNSFGAYEGRSTTAVRLDHGRPVAAYERQPGCEHPSLRYYPFPEASQLANL